ncbi:MAG TPA: hypothetical protein VGD64_10425 [Acidisarcina sp.]
MRRLFALAALLAVSMPTTGLLAQSHRDPLNEDEVDQIREFADRPAERVKLYMKFIQQRIDAVRQMSTDPNVQNKPAKLRNLMEEFTRLADELQDNLDNYEDTHSDVRKPLKDLIAASEKWPEVLRTPPPDRSYDFSRKTALEAAESANQQATKLLEDQTKYFAEHKKGRRDDPPPPK